MLKASIKIFILFFIFFFVVVLSLFLYFLNFFLSLKFFNLNKIRIFERGFQRVFKVQISFSIHFFIIVVLFVLFDLEVVILLGVLIRSEIMNFLFLGLVVFIFLGFYLE
jgi:NADH:ubiquinone oxidoreductase subunit 3 (subunit A)